MFKTHTINNNLNPARPLRQSIFAEVACDEHTLDHETNILGSALERVLPVLIVEVARNEKDGTEGGTRPRVTREVVPSEWLLLVLESCLVELDVFIV